MATCFSWNNHFVFYAFILLFPAIWGRNHQILLKDEVRQTIELSKFGFLQNGILKVNFSDMVVQGDRDKVLFGFSLEKTGSDGISPYMEQHSQNCILKDTEQSFTNTNQISLALIKFDLKSGEECITIDKYGKDFLNLSINNEPAPVLATVTTVSSSGGQSTSKTPILSSTVPNNATSSSSPTAESSSTSTSPSTQQTSATSALTIQAATSSSAAKSSTTSSSPSTRQTTAISVLTTQAASTTGALNHSSVAQPGDHETSNTTEGNGAQRRRRRNAVTNPVTHVKSEVKSLPLNLEETNVSEFKYSGNFVVQIKSKAEEGLYNLYFHNCRNGLTVPVVPVTIQINIEEKNGDNYLSAGEEPLPYMFGVLSVLFFGTSIYWLHILRKNREFTYKVHYMMFTLALLKSLDLMFQAVNFHFINRDGKPAESWEVLYYITHLLKGALLFTTIVLIGTGYFFIKHVLSDRDKKIFLIVIPLQILANTAQIVMESTEEANMQYTTWKELFILVDLLCCGAILFPVVWSIRHLQEGSQTDGKAALNLAKLKLFRHFYVMIVCYIYFTRIIVYLIKITVPFQYMWLDDFFNNAASYVFFVLTGYKFRPAPDNPYLHVPQGDSDDEMEMEEVVTNAGIADGVTRLQPSSNGKRIFETA
ncbi:protein GPR107-like [Orbicella faveolata]|uniref:protein GPR107-like n=1 Tax=Orbicella faveolata TaxID=48498 RepID=UPI0009E4E3B7|nr:protein GPR107-like [Orbicella faveolata]